MFKIDWSNIVVACILPLFLLMISHMITIHEGIDNIRNECNQMRTQMRVSHIRNTMDEVVTTHQYMIFDNTVEHAYSACLTGK
jgi:hypothetical protein